MKHLKKFENFNQPMVHMSEYPSVEEMRDYVCSCGYERMEVDEMSYSQVCNTYDKCKMEGNESRRYRKNENFNQDMMNNQPSEEEMMNYLCRCGFNEMDVMEMDFHELCTAYDQCKMEMNEARKNKKVSYKKSGLKNPHLADLDKDKKISGYEKARGKAVQKSIQNQKENKKVARK